MKDRVVIALQRLLALVSKLLLGRHVWAVVAKAETGLFAVHPQDFGVGGRLRITGRYGMDELERIRPHVTPESRVLVVGAHVGTLAIPLARLCREVVAIEANPQTFELLVANTQLNAAANCLPVRIAASDKAEELEFLASRVNSGGSKRVPRTRQFAYYADKPDVIRVPAVRLDEYLERQDFDVVVMDIEGSEYHAMQGMQRILAGCKVFVVEFLPHHLRDVAGVSVAQFLSQVQPHFSRLFVPSTGAESDAAGFLAVLTAMYERGQGDDGIMFSKR